MYPPVAQRASPHLDLVAYHWLVAEINLHIIRRTSRHQLRGTSTVNEAPAVLLPMAWGLLASEDVAVSHTPQRESVPSLCCSAEEGPRKDQARGGYCVRVIVSVDKQVMIYQEDVLRSWQGDTPRPCTQFCAGISGFQEKIGLPDPCCCCICP